MRKNGEVALAISIYFSKKIADYKLYDNMQTISEARLAVSILEEIKSEITAKILKLNKKDQVDLKKITTN